MDTTPPRVTHDGRRTSINSPQILSATTAASPSEDYTSLQRVPGSVGMLMLRGQSQFVRVTAGAL